MNILLVLVILLVYYISEAENSAITMIISHDVSLYTALLNQSYITITNIPLEGTVNYPWLYHTSIAILKVLGP